jgi:hypothetical protein
MNRRTAAVVALAGVLVLGLAAQGSDEGGTSGFAEKARMILVL